MDDFLSSIGMRYLLLNAHQIGITGVTGIKRNKFCKEGTTYHTLAIINRGLYISHPIFHSGSYCRAVSVTNSSFTKQENASVCGLKSAVYNQERFEIKRGL